MQHTTKMSNKMSDKAGSVLEKKEKQTKDVEEVANTEAQ